MTHRTVPNQGNRWSGYAWLTLILSRAMAGSMPRPRPTEPKLFMRRGVFHILWWDGPVRRFISCATAEPAVAQKTLKRFNAALRGHRRKLNEPHAMQVYVISSEAGPQKIGISTTPSSRLAGLQSANAHRLSIAKLWTVSTAQAMHAERMVAQRLAHCRMLGEWYDTTSEEACGAVEYALAWRAEAPATG